MKPTRILFTGYAPVHFVCFRPLFERLRRRPDVHVFVSGGLREEEAQNWAYDPVGMYGPFGLPEDCILSVDQVREQDFDVLYAANTKLIMPRSVTTRIQIFHGISFRNRTVREENRSCDYYFVVGPYMRRRFVESGLFEDDDPKLVPIGFMKTDRLLNGALERADLLAQYGLSGQRPIILYAPTGARHNSLETMGEEVIGRLVADGRYDLLIKLHDHPKNKKIDWPSRLARFQGPHCRLMTELDIIPLLSLADLLISDASSVSNEYALLDRPIVFLDVPELLAHYRDVEQSMLDLDTWGRKGGSVVTQADQIEETVAGSLAHPETYSGVRRAMVRDLFYHPGSAAAHAVSWLEQHVLSPEAELATAGERR